MFNIIVAKAGKTIGLSGTIPWRAPKDLARFKSLTLGKTVIMGRKTWDSLPKKPLPGRYNIVITSKSKLVDYYPDNLFTVSNFEESLELGRYLEEDIFVIGGSQLYKEALNHNSCDKLYITEILGRYSGDTFFPGFNKNIFKKVSEEYHPAELTGKEEKNETVMDVKNSEAVKNPIESSGKQTLLVPGMIFKTYKRHEEYQYLNLIRNIINKGQKKSVTLTLPGNMMRFSLENDTIPVLTTKKVFWKGVTEELVWFINGSTNCSDLNSRGVRIWNANGTRDFLDSRGLCNYEENELGPVYGFQWRNFGKAYYPEDQLYESWCPHSWSDDGDDCDCGKPGGYFQERNAWNEEKGVDQLQKVIDMIRDTPDSRRIILNSWNAADIDKMALPPCHVMCQFLVQDGNLTCLMYQRSCDMGLGVPFNIASYSLLTHIIAKITGTKAKEFIHFMADTHVYTEHIMGLEEQLKREPKKFPTLKLPDNLDINNLSASDFKLVGYDCHGEIKMKLIV